MLGTVLGTLESEISDPLATNQALELDPFSDLYQELLVLSGITGPIRNYWSYHNQKFLILKFGILQYSKL